MVSDGTDSIIVTTKSPNEIECSLSNENNYAVYEVDTDSQRMISHLNDVFPPAYGYIDGNRCGDWPNRNTGQV